MQKYTSKNTSVNTISKIYKQYPFEENSIILDYGCGKYDSSIDFMSSKNCRVLPYDKYNRSIESNNKTLEYCINNHLDYVVCSNVLNVILEDKIIYSILEDIYNYSDENTIILLSIYEGNKSGIGKETSKGFQRNLSYKSYIPFIEKYFEFKISKQIFICKKKGKNNNESLV